MRINAERELFKARLGDCFAPLHQLFIMHATTFVTGGSATAARHTPTDANLVACTKTVQAGAECPSSRTFPLANLNAGRKQFLPQPNAYSLPPRRLPLPVRAPLSGRPTLSAAGAAGWELAGPFAAAAAACLRELLYLCPSANALPAGTQQVLEAIHGGCSVVMRGPPAGKPGCVCGGGGAAAAGVRERTRKGQAA